MFIVVPKLVEMATKSLATIFRPIIRRGPSATSSEVIKTINNAKERLKNASAHIQKKVKASIEILGCMKVANASEEAAYQISRSLRLLLARIEDLRNAPKAIKKHAAALTSYPIAGALRKRVGLKLRKSAEGQNKVLKMVS
jgi:hypothetical protein